jgi:hypothetical protein
LPFVELVKGSLISLAAAIAVTAAALTVPDAPAFLFLAGRAIFARWADGGYVAVSIWEWGWAAIAGNVLAWWALFGAAGLGWWVGRSRRTA